MILILGIFINIILLALLLNFEPSINRLKTGEWVIWYNSDRRRKFTKFKKLF